ncbi:MAG: type VI secretion system lipoprotein TssJ [Nitrospiraceae bacterium]|nr:MAG: type VI secretion system lipoprotein TssJ [Nitrospiraceae bacterium]
MKKTIRALLAVSFVLTIVSCASAPKYVYEEGAINLRLKSGPDVNLYDGKAHTLLLCVYQLRDPNAFNQLFDEEDGISKLLECSRFDPSVMSSKRIVVQPNEDSTKTLDRSEGTKYVGIVAGYFQMEKKNITRLMQVPLGMLTGSPKKMDIGLYLGPKEIQEIGGK